MPQVLLASTSPRRIELMRLLGVPFKPVASSYREVMHQNKSPRALAVYLARGKANAVLTRYPKSIVVAADTFVTIGNNKLGKAKTDAEAFAMLKKISGKKVTVITALVCRNGARKQEKIIVHHNGVWFRKISNSEAKQYIKTGEARDKAGSFAMQGKGAVFIKRMSGTYASVLGLPLFELAQILEQWGVVLWKK